MDYNICGVYNAEKIKKEKKEKYYLALENYSDHVSIKAVNSAGDFVSYICTVNKTTGKVSRCYSISDKLGFDLDWYGKVKVE